jgi:hypothetical protein
MGGQPGLCLKSFHVLGDKTRVSQAATVNVQTKKYLCADRWGGRFKYAGRMSRGLISPPPEEGDVPLVVVLDIEAKMQSTSMEYGPG